MKKLFFILFFISSLFSFEVVDATKSNIIALHNKNIPIIDIRTPYEWKATGTIPFAKKITFFTRRGINPDFLKELYKNNINKNSKFALICRTGHRSLAASKILEENGFKNVISLKGGMFRLFKDMLNKDLGGK